MEASPTDSVRSVTASVGVCYTLEGEGYGVRKSEEETGMTKLLLKWFVRNWENPQDPAVRASVGKLAGTAGIVCNLLLFFGKLLAGLLAGSVGIVADAMNNLTDCASSVATLAGFRLARRPADEHHPYGHARYEYLTGLVVSFLILLVGVELAGSSLEKIIRPQPLKLSVASVLVLIGAILMKLWMWHFNRTLGRYIDSETLMVTAQDSRNDVLATSGVLAGCVIGQLSGWDLDGFVGLAVALFILISGLRTLKETSSPLLGRQADRELVEAINALLLKREQVLGIHDLLVHDYGPGQCFASVHAELSAGENPMRSHDIIDGIEREVLEKLNVHLVIHYDPVRSDDHKWNKMRCRLETITGEIDPRISLHDLRMTEEQERIRLSFDLAVPYAMLEQKERIRERIVQTLGNGYICDIHFDGSSTQ